MTAPSAKAKIPATGFPLAAKLFAPARLDGAYLLARLAYPPVPDPGPSLPAQIRQHNRQDRRHPRRPPHRLRGSDIQPHEMRLPVPKPVAQDGMTIGQAKSCAELDFLTFERKPR